MGNNAAHPAAASYAVCICPVVRLAAMVIHRKGQLCRTSYAVCMILVMPLRIVGVPDTDEEPKRCETPASIWMHS